MSLTTHLSTSIGAEESTDKDLQYEVPHEGRYSVRFLRAQTSGDTEGQRESVGSRERTPSKRSCDGVRSTSSHLECCCTHCSYGSLHVDDSGGHLRTYKARVLFGRPIWYCTAVRYDYCCDDSFVIPVMENTKRLYRNRRIYCIAAPVRPYHTYRMESYEFALLVRGWEAVREFEGNVPSIRMLFYDFGDIFCSNGKNPGERCFLVLGKIGHFRQGRTRAYEHRLGPNSVRSLTENQPCSPLAYRRQGLQSPWKNFLIFAVLTLTLRVQT